MATAIIGGLIKQGMARERLLVVEPFETARQALADKFQITAQDAAHNGLSQAEVVVWAVKPQLFKEASAPVAAHTAQALHLSVAAGIPSDSIASWLGSQRVVRSMPNTPALIGLGMTGLYARAAIQAKDRALVERIVSTMGEFLWLEREAQLDAVTALSGSGPAYVFYFLEAMVAAGTEMGLSAAQSYQLAVQTFKGASALAQASSEPPHVLRERVTSKGGTTYAAITSLQDSQVSALFVKALHAAEQRARELGQEFGQD